jgi:hypothetical protein
MRIAIDGNCLRQRMAGNETYLVNLLRGLAKIDVDSKYPVLAGDTVSLPRDIRAGGDFSVTTMAASSALLPIPLVLPSLLRHISADLLQVTYVAAPVSPCPHLGDHPRYLR